LKDQPVLTGVTGHESGKKETHFLDAPAVNSGGRFRQGQIEIDCFQTIQAPMAQDRPDPRQGVAASAVDDNMACLIDIRSCFHLAPGRKGNLSRTCTERGRHVDMPADLFDHLTVMGGRIVWLTGRGVEE